MDDYTVDTKDSENTNEPVWVAPTPEAEETVISYINEVVNNQLPEIDQAKEEIKTSAAMLFENFGFPKTLFNKLCKIKYNSNLEEEKQKMNDIINMYETLLK